MSKILYCTSEDYFVRIQLSTHMGPGRTPMFQLTGNTGSGSGETFVQFTTKDGEQIAKAIFKELDNWKPGSHHITPEHEKDV